MIIPGFDHLQVHLARRGLANVLPLIRVSYELGMLRDLIDVDAVPDAVEELIPSADTDAVVRAGLHLGLLLTVTGSAERAYDLFLPAGLRDRMGVVPGESPAAEHVARYFVHLSA